MYSASMEHNGDIRIENYSKLRPLSHPTILSPLYNQKNFEHVFGKEGKEYPTNQDPLEMVTLRMRLLYQSIGNLEFSVIERAIGNINHAYLRCSRSPNF